MPSRRLLSASTSTRSRTPVRTASGSVVSVPTVLTSRPLCSSGLAALRALAGGRRRLRVAAVEYLEQAVPRDHPHVEPLLFVVRVVRVHAGELVVRRVQVADVAKRLAPALAREYLVDHRGSSSAPVRRRRRGDAARRGLPRSCARPSTAGPTRPGSRPPRRPAPSAAGPARPRE